MNTFKVIAFTHKNLDLAKLGKLHIEENAICQRLYPFKALFNIEELMLLSTCNRVEFLLSYNGNISNTHIQKWLRAAYPLLDEKEITELSSKANIYEGEEALKHLFNVASSLDSLVVGEREIITQVRNAYDLCRKNNLTGDLIRLVVQRTIECAKQVYTQTNISRNPVSVVSLAYRKLKSLNVKLDAKFLIVGAGVTNTTMAKYLCKHGFTDFAVFNRTMERGEKLAAELGTKAYALAELINYNKGFDVIVTCTGASEPVITKEIFDALVKNSLQAQTKKDAYIVIDLAVPNDLDSEILNVYEVNLIAVNNLQEIAKKNLAERENELAACNRIVEDHLLEFEQEFKIRKVELAMREIPKKVKEIRHTAINEVFARDIGMLDSQSKETLDKVISYLEKKYISVPMKMAREVMMGSSLS